MGIVILGATYRYDSAEYIKNPKMMEPVIAIA